MTVTIRKHVNLENWVGEWRVENLNDFYSISNDCGLTSVPEAITNVKCKYLLNDFVRSPSLHLLPCEVCAGGNQYGFGRR